VSEAYPVTYVSETGGGNEITWSFSYEAAEEIVGWSTSQALLELGAKGPEIQAALRKAFGGSGG
jgi:hypothetical protein